MTITTSIGPVKYVIPAHLLIEAGWLATPNITVLQLNDQQRLDKIFEENEKVQDSDTKFTYDNETDFLSQDQPRRQWIADFIIEKGSAHKGKRVVSC